MPGWWLLLISASLVTTSAEAAVEWSHERVATRTLTAAVELDLDIDASGVAHATWIDANAAGYVICYGRRFAPGVWVTQIVDTIPTLSAVSFAVTPSGTPHFAYLAGNGCARHRAFESGGWSKKDFCVQGILAPMVAITPSGDPVIAYSYEATASALGQLAFVRTGGAWEPFWIGTGANVYGASARGLEIDSGGNPHQLYRVRFATNPPPTVFYIGPPLFGIQGPFPNITEFDVGSDNLPQLLYDFRETSPPAWWVYHWKLGTASRWRPAYSIPAIRAALDHQNRIHGLMLGYPDASHQAAFLQRLDYAGPDGDATVRDSVDGSMMALAFDVENRPHVVYSHGDPMGSSGHAILHATIADIPTPVRTATVRAEYLRGAVQVQISADSPDRDWTIERSQDHGPFHSRATVPSRSGIANLVDGDVLPGHEYGYRVESGDAAWVRIGPRTLAIRSIEAIPFGIRVSGDLPESGAVAELLDVGGRRIERLVLTGGDRDPFEFTLRAAELSRSALFFLRLRSKDETVVRRVAVLH